jgi:choloylglycine hydrolase
VLTNNTYDESVKSYKNSSTNGNNSLQRFGQACNMIQQLKADNNIKPVIDYAFDILGEVAQGNYTKWSIVYDITNKTIQFRTNRFKQIKTVSFSSFDFNCSSTAKVWDMNQTGNGSISNLFENFSATINKRIVETAAKESEQNVAISQQNRERLWKYASEIKCK